MGVITDIASTLVDVVVESYDALITFIDFLKEILQVFFGCQSANSPLITFVLGFLVLAFLGFCIWVINKIAVIIGSIL